MDKIKPIIMRFGIPLAFAAYAYILSLPHGLYAFLSAFLVLAVSLLVCRRYSHRLEGIVKNTARAELLLCGAFSAATALIQIFSCIGGKYTVILYPVLFAVLFTADFIITAVINSIYHPLDMVKGAIHRLTRLKASIIGAALAVFSLLSVYATVNTTAFISGTAEGGLLSNLLLPPLSIPAHLLALPLSLFFGWNKYSYFLGFGMTVVQAMITIFSVYLVYKILKTVFAPAISFFISGIYLFSYSAFLFTLTVEQCVAGTAALLLFVRFSGGGERESLPAFCAAAGTSPFSLVAFPFLFFNGKKGLCRTVRMIGGFITIVLLSGGLYKLCYFSLPEGFFPLSGEKVGAFFAGISALFLPPAITGGASVPVGIVLFVLSIGSGIYFFRQYCLARMSLYWVIASAIFMGMAGAESCGLYFTWAYLILLFLLFVPVFKKYKVQAAFVLAGIIILLSALDIQEFFALVRAGQETAPVLYQGG